MCGIQDGDSSANISHWERKGSASTCLIYTLEGQLFAFEMLTLPALNRLKPQESKHASAEQGTKVTTLFSFRSNRDYTMLHHLLLGSERSVTSLYTSFFCFKIIKGRQRTGVFIAALIKWLWKHREPKAAFVLPTAALSPGWGMSALDVLSDQQPGNEWQFWFCRTVIHVIMRGANETFT